MPLDEDSIELKTFFCSIDPTGGFAVSESRAVDDGGVKRPSWLTGDGQSVYGALAKLCFMKMEMEGRQSEITDLCKYYMGIYGNAA